VRTLTRRWLENTQVLSRWRRARNSPSSPLVVILQAAETDADVTDNILSGL